MAKKVRYPYEIGGHSIELKQMALALRRMVKDEFDMNSVPDNVVKNLDLLIISCEECESRLYAAISAVREIPGHEEFLG
jgi:hypothetical protein